MALADRVLVRECLTIGGRFLSTAGIALVSRAADTSQPTAARARQTFFGGRSVAKKKAAKKGVKKATKKSTKKKAAKKKK